MLDLSRADLHGYLSLLGSFFFLEILCHESFVLLINFFPHLTLFFLLSAWDKLARVLDQGHW